MSMTRPLAIAPTPTPIASKANAAADEAPGVEGRETSRRRPILAPDPHEAQRRRASQHPRAPRAQRGPVPPEGLGASRRPSPAALLLLALLMPNAARSLTSPPSSPRRYGRARRCAGGKFSFSARRRCDVASLSAGTLRFRRRANHDRCPPLRVSNDNNDDNDAASEQRKQKGKPHNSKRTEDDGSAAKDRSNDGNYGNDKMDTPNRTGAQPSEQDAGAKAKPNLLALINPFNAGKSLRSSVASAFDLASAIAADPAARLPPDRRAIYYNYDLDDRLQLSRPELKDDPKFDAAPASSLPSAAPDGDDRPEVLVVGAAGALGRVLVKRLLLENKVRVRVLVRDLYSSTLERLGAGVTYCPGTLGDVPSLEYAVTDVDKIVFCAGGKRVGGGDRGEGVTHGRTHEEEDWGALESVLDQRSKGAAEIDGDGLRNLIQAYLNVRHADYGTSFAGAAKRVLFKFRKRPADFGLFGIDDGSMDGTTNDLEGDDEQNDRREEESERRSAAPAPSQCDWIRNKFGHGAFVGRVGRGGESAVASARLRARGDPARGLDLRAAGFAGLVLRVCGDGGVYEAFVRTEAYASLGVEYVCEFRTPSKAPDEENASRTKFGTVRLEFSDFRPRMRRFRAGEGEDARKRMREALGRREIPPFFGDDIRQLGFRYRAQNNPSGWSGGASNSGWSKFYLALDYIKVYRGSPEPEFVYLSDARIPPVVNDAMVQHDLHRLVTSSSSESSTSYSIIDDKKAAKFIKDKMDRSAEETYFKYMGEEMIKQSGLSYTIIRVAGYNAEIGTDSSAVRLQKMNKNITAVSRVDLAQVIASALLTPNACNLILYMTKAQQRGVLDGDIWQKFARLRSENEQAPLRSENEAPFQ